MGQLSSPNTTPLTLLLLLLIMMMIVLVNMAKMAIANSVIRRVMSKASSSSLKQTCSAFTSATSALDVKFDVMRSTKSRFTYLLTYLLDTGPVSVQLHWKDQDNRSDVHDSVRPRHHWLMYRIQPSRYYYTIVVVVVVVVVVAEVVVEEELRI